MITVDFNDSKFFKDMNNAVAYATGFLDGTKLGKQSMLENFGESLKEIVGQFIDSNARVDPASLHHVYEWYETGNPGARLFDISYIAKAGGLTINGTLTQSSSLSSGSTSPFYNKARIMESGTPVTISPKRASVLRFEDGGQEVFTKGPITVSNPGGDSVAGSFNDAFKTFFETYASQSLLQISGLYDQLKTPVEFSNSFASGVRGGRSVGVSAGIKYITGGKK